MAKGMIKELEARIAQMEAFDVTLAEAVEDVQDEVDNLSINFNAEEISSDKSVRSHIRKRTQKINNVIARFKRDLKKAIADLQNDEETEEVVTVEDQAQGGNE